MDNGVRRVYTVQAGQLHETVGLPDSWHDGVIPTNGPVTDVSAVIINGVRRVYVTETQDGKLHEIVGLNGWTDAVVAGGNSQVSGVSAVNDGGTRRVYTIE
jgi:hypothetical protein